MPFKLPYTSYIRITFTGRLILYCLNSAYSAPNNNNTKSVHIIKRRTTIHDTAIRRRILYCIYTLHWPPKIALPYVLWHARETLTHNNNNETTHEPKENSQHFGVRNQKKRAPAMSKICYAKEKSSSRKVRAQHRRQTQHIWDNTSPSIRNHNKLCVRDQPMCMCVFFFISEPYECVCVYVCLRFDSVFDIYILKTSTTLCRTTKTRALCIVWWAKMCIVWSSICILTKSIDLIVYININIYIKTYTCDSHVWVSLLHIRISYSYGLNHIYNSLQRVHIYPMYILYADDWCIFYAKIICAVVFRCCCCCSRRRRVHWKYKWWPTRPDQSRRKMRASAILWAVNKEVNEMLHESLVSWI